MRSGTSGAAVVCRSPRTLGVISNIGAHVKSQRRTRVPAKVAIEVYTEAGYRCAVPTCRGILALDLHHIEPVRSDGPNNADNLLPLCPTCHALFERGNISAESIVAWKAYLRSLSRAYDHNTLDLLWFLKKVPNFSCSADGLVSFARLIGAGLAELKLSQQGFNAMVGLSLSSKGDQLLKAWIHGDKSFLGGIPK